MKKRFCVIFGGPKLCVVLKSKNQEERSFEPDIFFGQVISRGSPEVTFCSWTKFQRAYGRLIFFEKKFGKNLIIPAAHGQLEKTDLGLSDMDSGHVDGSISGPDRGPTSKNNTSLA